MAKKRKLTCLRGHDDGRYKSGQCITCGRAAARKRYAAKKEQILKQRREKYAADPTAQREQAKTWAKKNPEKRRKNERRYYARNRQKIRAKQAAYVLQNKDHKDRKRVRKHNRLARQRGAGGSFSSQDIRTIFKLQRGRCAYCRCDLNKVECHIDHIIALKNGGGNMPSNLQLLCKTCNLSKSSSDPLEFARRIGRLI